jgi:hypothetical protein
MLTLCKQVAGGPENCLLVAQAQEPVACAKGMAVFPHASFATYPPLDDLLVPGGWGTRTAVSARIAFPILSAMSSYQGRP